MIFDALLAYLHYIAIFLLFSLVTVELMLLKHPLTPSGVRLISRIDMYYAGAAVLTLATGLMRLFMGAKGASFYLGNPVFYGKVALFFVVGGLSVIPTLKFVQWGRALRENPQFTPPADEQARLRGLVKMQIHLAALLPLFAVMMSRGVGH